MRIVGDRAAELEQRCARGSRHDLLVVSGGLGPTHDDRTVELLAAPPGAALVLDDELEGQIETWSRE